MIKQGNDKVVNLYLGNYHVCRVYMGNDLIAEFCSIDTPCPEYTKNVYKIKYRKQDGDAGFTYNGQLYKLIDNEGTVSLSGPATSLDFSGSATLETPHPMLEIDLSEFDSSGLTDMEGTFTHNHNLEKLVCNGMDTANVKVFASTFSNLTNVKKLEVGCMDVSAAQYFVYCFAGNESLVTLDLKNWSTDSAKSLQGMFGDCKSLKTLKIPNFKVESAPAVNEMFFNCNELQTIECTQSFKDYIGKNLGSGLNHAMTRDLFEKINWKIVG